MFRIRNARIYSKGKTKLADILVKGGKIGRIDRGNTRRKSGRGDYDAGGRLVLPSFIDCHTHLFSLAVQQEIIQLGGSGSVTEMLERVRSHSAQNGHKSIFRGWVIGRGWDQEMFHEKRFPNKHDLDKALWSLPAIMTRVCGHVAVLNSLAIQKLSERGAFDDVGNDLLPLGDDGRPTGLVKESALESCWEAVPPPSERELESLFLKTQKRCLGFGLTGAHCILSDDWKTELSCLRRLDSKRKLKLKVSIFLPISVLPQFERLTSRRRNSLFRGRNFLLLGFKLYADGSLGARTAALEEPYSDDRNNRGVLNYSSQEIIIFAKKIKRLGMMLATHAIGDRAVDQVLRAYKEAGVKSADCFRIEHCSILRNNLLDKIKIAQICVQPMFAKSDYWMDERIGGTGKRFAYPFRRMSRMCKLIGGSDAPVESIDPLSGIRAAIENGGESLSIRQSLDLYTQNAASASPLTKNCGEVSLGKSCDLVVLDCLTPKEIANSKVVATFVNGKLVSQGFST